MKIQILGAAALFISACAATEDPSTSTANSDVVTPSSVNANVTSVAYNAGPDTLTLVLSGLDSSATQAVYRRNTQLDVGAYSAYSTQDDPLDRHFTALRRSSADGSLIAMAVADGGQFNRYFGGTQYARSGSYSPDTGLASYAGTYAGVTNVASVGSDLLTVPAGTDTAIRPQQSARTSGNVFLNVDFGENAVNGGIYNRILRWDEADPTNTSEMPDIVLVRTDISETGQFSGSVEYDLSVPSSNTGSGGIGTYAGIFGGTRAASVAGLVYLNEFDGPGGTLLGEEEYGIFVLSQCGETSASTLCD